MGTSCWRRGATRTSGGGGGAAACVRPHPVIARVRTAKRMNNNNLVEQNPSCLCIHWLLPVGRGAGLPAMDQRSKMRAKAHMTAGLRKRLRRKADSHVKRVGTLQLLRLSKSASTASKARRISTGRFLQFLGL